MVCALLRHSHNARMSLGQQTSGVADSCQRGGAMQRSHQRQAVHVKPRTCLTVWIEALFCLECTLSQPTLGSSWSVYCSSHPQSMCYRCQKQFPRKGVHRVLDSVYYSCVAQGFFKRIDPGHWGREFSSFLEFLPVANRP